jgi:nucleoside-diphosphate-sugar epimerase
METMKPKHCIIGAGGSVGSLLSAELNAMGVRMVLAGRNPTKVNPDDEIIRTDARNPDEVRNAVKNTETAYLLLGLPYNTAVWKRDWPIVMDNAIKACSESNTKLVFFDNVYMYGRVNGWMTEETTFNPCSRKGEVRANIATKLLDEIKSGNINALIARSADFYGANALNTFVVPMAFQKLKQGKKASWLGNDEVKHSMTYTPDAAKAVALLGITKSAFGQTWHLPTHHDALTGKEFIETIAAYYGVKASYQKLSAFMMKLVGLFNPMAKESAEMMYQFEHEYLFSSKKFQDHFFEAVTYAEGIRETAAGI